jgi:hypothetical protein
MREPDWEAKWYAREPSTPDEDAHYGELAERHWPVSVLAQPGDEECSICGKRFRAGEDVMVGMPSGEFAHDECLEELA